MGQSCTFQASRSGPSVNTFATIIEIADAKADGKSHSRLVVRGLEVEATGITPDAGFCKLIRSIIFASITIPPACILSAQTQKRCQIFNDQKQN